VLRDLDGTPLMAGHDPRGDLAPRDVVAARMAAVIEAGPAGHVWLDATALGRKTLEEGFPTVTAACRKHGIDPVTEYIPVAPGAHYSCGGILADLDGRTTVPGLYAVGEAASTGVQGANRLASNSVTEAIIAGRRAGAAIAGSVRNTGQVSLWRAPSTAAQAPDRPIIEPNDAWSQPGGLGAAGRLELAGAMSRWAGVQRDAEGLGQLVRVIAAGDAPRGSQPAAVLDLESVEAANLRVVSALIAAGALRRTESRGCHRRRDAAETASRPWHTLTRLNRDELLVAEEEM
jgi:L-aspartate oxidase